MSTLRVSLASAFTVLRTAGRVLWDHWPVLLSLALVGQGLRLALIWAAVALSDHQSFLAQILLAMSPLAFLLPLIVMVIIAGSRLPRISTLREVKAPDDVTTHRERRLIDVMASVLAPFFGVYVGLGLFDDDLQYFKNSASVAEFDPGFTNQANFDPTDRIGLYAWWVVALLVVGAWVVRWLLARAERSKPWALLAVTGVLVEFYYTAQVANLLVVWKFDALSWITTRKRSDGFDGYESLMAQGSWFADPLRWAWDLISSFDSVIVVPVAWLLLGSIVLGYKLHSPYYSHRRSPRERATRPTRPGEFADHRRRTRALFGLQQRPADADSWRFRCRAAVLPRLRDRNPTAGSGPPGVARHPRADGVRLLHRAGAL